MSGAFCCLRVFDGAQAKIEAIARGERGNVTDLMRILDWNRSLNINMLRYEAEGYSVLHLASMSSNAAFIEGLLYSHRKVDADARSTLAGYTALHLCSWKGDLAIAKLFCERALVDLEIKSREGFTALHYAAWAGSVELCFYLVSVGANLKAKNKHGYTPLLVAARAGNEDAVHFLIEQSSVDIDEIDNDGCSSLHHACYEGHQKVVTVLLKNAANSTLRDKLGRTPKDLCKSRDLADIISSIYVPSVGEKKRTTFKLKVAAPIKTTISSPSKIDTEAAAAGGGEEGGGGTSKYRLENLGEKYLSSLPSPPTLATLSPQMKKKVSPTRLANAAAGGGVEQKEEGDGGYTLPAASGENGVGLHVAPKVAQECWRLCSTSGDAAALRRLLTAYTALTHGQPSPLYYLRDTDNWTLCMRAASKGYLEVVKVLLSVDSGAASASCDHGWNALHRAAAAGRIEVVNLLLSLLDADGTPSVRVDAKTERGATALMKAAEFGHVDVCQALVLKGADENEKDKEGFTALHLASLYAHRDVVILLVSECQANPLAMTVEGDLPEDFTRSKHIKSLLRAVQFHHTKSASFPVPITSAQEAELTQAWRAVDMCIEQLRRHQGSPAKGTDRIQRTRRAGDATSPAAEALPVSPSASNSPNRRDRYLTPGTSQRENQARSRGVANPQRAGAGSGSRSGGRNNTVDATKSAWDIIRTARSKRGTGLSGLASAQSKGDKTTFSLPKRVDAAPSPIAGGSLPRGGPSPSTFSVSGSPPFTVTSRPTSPTHAIPSAATSAANSPDNHMMSLRERLKVKYKLIDEEQGAAKHGHEHGRSPGEDGEAEVEDEDGEDSADEVGYPLLPHDAEGIETSSTARSSPSGKTVFHKVPKEDVDALAAMAMAEDLMKEKDGEGDALPSTTRKDMKGSLLLTMILTQVHMVYSNKMSRAFYRWKHRFSSSKGSKSENTGPSSSPTRHKGR